jgi:hypothetical protein
MDGARVAGAGLGAGAGAAAAGPTPGTSSTSNDPLSSSVAGTAKSLDASGGRSMDALISSTEGSRARMGRATDGMADAA